MPSHSIPSVHTRLVSLGLTTSSYSRAATHSTHLQTGSANHDACSCCLSSLVVDLPPRLDHLRKAMLLLPRRARGLLKDAFSRTTTTTTSSSSSSSRSSSTITTTKTSRLPAQDQRTLKDFLAASQQQQEGASTAYQDSSEMSVPDASTTGISSNPEPKTFTIESYGCQQNAADSEVVRAIMEAANYKFVEGGGEQGHHIGCDIVFLNTCAIRDNAEQRIWGRLKHLKHPPRRPRSAISAPSRRQAQAWPPQRAPEYRKPVIGLLGCMAERLKTKLLEEEAVDLVVGPDAYRDLPRLLDVVEGGEKGVNIQLSMDETYAEIKPSRISPDNKSAFVSIMRGCNNMCSYCIVPHTRGRERSRPVHTIVEEVRRLAGQGVKEVVLLGQNVNSFHDTSTSTVSAISGGGYEVAEGFSNLYKSRDKAGARFVDLLEAVSRVDEEVRIRFTSPHPKDFPLPLLQLIAERPSLCASLHLPAQSGSSSVLQRMRRGYTREAYLALVERAREVIPNVALSSDFIAGFCEETEEEHLETLSLIEAVGYDQAFLYAYSLRERTHAAYHLQDNVPEPEKQRRLAEIIATFRRVAAARNAIEVGREHLVLVEGPSKRSTPEKPTWTGRSDTNKRCILPYRDVPASVREGGKGPLAPLQPGDYAWVRVTEAKAQTLFCDEILGRSSVREFAAATAAAAARTSARMGTERMMMEAGAL